MNVVHALVVLLVLLLAWLALPQGQRPYELVWAGRTQDNHLPLVDFTDTTGWTVETESAVAALESTSEQLIFADRVAKLTYRRDGTGTPVVRLVPPAPIEIPLPFDSANFWVYGNNWGWIVDPTTPQVEIRLVIASPGGEKVRLSMSNVRWQEWWVMHSRLTAAQRLAAGPNPHLEALEIVYGTNKADRVIYLANLAFYKEPLPPLVFEPRPLRNLTPFPGQTTGTNTGPGKLPFPTREETLLPSLSRGPATVSLSEAAGTYTWTSLSDETLVWTYTPRLGNWSDITLQSGESAPFSPLAGGGVCLLSEAGAPLLPERAELRSCELEGDTVRARWRLFAEDKEVSVEYVFRVWGKSLVIDTLAPGGQVAEVRFGDAQGEGLDEPRLVTMPFLTYGGNRPAVLVTGSAEEPAFLAGFPDYYRSNASRLEARNQITSEGAACYNGAAIYLPKTDGTRNDCFERFFINASSRFEEVLPTIANPRSPWFDVTSERVWIAHGAWDRKGDYAHWQRYSRLGMTEILITDHETGWRDGGESFTLRTKAAPGRGGDESQAWYSKAIQDLGFRYGIYNNYTDFSPVNEYWDEDFVSRLSDGQWRPAWPRCYHLKPSRAVELEAKIAPIIQEKFNLSTAYCDVHTAVHPWDYTDFDARVPGAAAFTSTIYSYGEIMLHQKATWNGPVYSEGRAHWYYVGLTDGNYGQDPEYRIPQNPWLVDFDLRKMHPLCVGFGMGNPGMFYPMDEGLGSGPERVTRLDRFLAATVAFGHPGFFEQGAGLDGTARAYFLIQQLATEYADELVATIEYADAEGRMLDTSHAVASGAYTRNQIRNTYANGCVTVVNGNEKEDWAVELPSVVMAALGLKGNKVVLPPNGWAGYLLDGDKVLQLAASLNLDGHRFDYALSPAYTYMDGRGSFTRLPEAAAEGSFAAIKREDGSLEVFPYVNEKPVSVAFSGQSASAVALDFAENELGPAQVQFCRGQVLLSPVEGATSYLLTPKSPPAITLQSERTEVVPGETVLIKGAESHEYTIPSNTPPNTRLVVELEGAAIDFWVKSMVDAALRLPSFGEREAADAVMVLTLRSALAAPAQVKVDLAGQVKQVELIPGQTVQLPFAWREPANETLEEIPLTVSSATSTYQRSWWLLAELGRVQVAEVPTTYDVGECLREGQERPPAAATGAWAASKRMSCGGVERMGIFMHPPWMTGPGYSYALLAPVKLPADVPATFSCVVGKMDGSDRGDGILFKLAIVDESGHSEIVASQLVEEHLWLPLEADLSAWAGQQVRFKLISDVGEQDNSSGDWACWAEFTLESAEELMDVGLYDSPRQLKHSPGPYELQDVTLADLHNAVSGWVQYEAAGLQAEQPYVSELVINGINLGTMPSGTGGEAEMTWGEPVRLPLTKEAIQALTPATTVQVENLGADYFRIRGFCVVVELADGRLFSSTFHTNAYTQPSDWPYAVGTGVPHGTPIIADVRFKLAP